ncbi:hypothetical protein PLESTB_001702800 [Pleodorina starrii]|uniref:Uncharacterized protein n=1 Tax=Pleodorina starrii TaxID=330485 RepID=A0A9W6BZ68_9CHLO|nr:hypothetical protein PLESTB_001702800 [Pleodorina starrii]
MRPRGAASPPSAPPLSLPPPGRFLAAAALHEGVLPFLERLMCRAGEQSASPEATVLGGVATRGAVGEFFPVALAYGKQDEAAALVATVGKLFRRLEMESVSGGIGMGATVPPQPLLPPPRLDHSLAFALILASSTARHAGMLATGFCDDDDSSESGGSGGTGGSGGGGGGGGSNNAGLVTPPPPPLPPVPPLPPLSMLSSSQKPVTSMPAWRAVLLQPPGSGPAAASSVAALKVAAAAALTVAAVAADPLELALAGSRLWPPAHHREGVWGPTAAAATVSAAAAAATFSAAKRCIGPETSLRHSPNNNT